MLAISSCNHEDVLEVDGASNNSVDEIRALNETVSYSPQRSRYKVYIIDEVHMLSTSAFNALLKTLEEPPEHVVFVFATTEIQKIPATVVGRCQTFYLNKIPGEKIYQRILEILEIEKVIFEKKAISYIVKQGRGSLRDALTYLDQTIAMGDGSVKNSNIEQLEGHVSVDKYISLIQALIVKNPNKCLELIEEFDLRGLDFSELATELCSYIRHAFIAGQIGAEQLAKRTYELSLEEIKSLSNLHQQAGKLELNRIFRSLMQCCKDLEGSHIDRFIFENYCLEWCLDPGFPSIEELISKKKVLKNETEQKIKSPRKSEITVNKTEQVKEAIVSKEKNQEKIYPFPESWKD